MRGQKYLPKTGGFQPKWEGWYLLGISLQEFFSLEISLHLICFSEFAHTLLKSQMASPLWPLFTSLCNQIGKWLKKPGRRAYSVSRASKDLSSESMLVQNSVKNRVLHTGLVLNSLTLYACCFFDLFNTDDHINRVHKELKQVCIILIIMYMYSHSLCSCNLGFE